MRILIACEESGTVREVFKNLGHDVMSCDIQATRIPGNHYQGDIFDVLYDGWDMMIAFPPCTHISLAGARHFEKKRQDGRQQEGIDFFIKIAEAPIDRICIENPVGVMSTYYRKPDQIIQPYYFGDEAQKTTCLWLKNLPQLYHNDRPNLFDETVTHVGKGEFWVGPTGKKMPMWYNKNNIPGEGNRQKSRSVTFPGIAKAMGDNWCNLKPLNNIKP